MKILFYKVPSYIHRVKCKKAVEDLYKTVISDDKFENLTILKTIANVAFGLLKKSYNRKTVSRIFDHLKEALQHQKKNDGRIYAMNEEEYEEYFRWRELEEDWTIEVDENNKPFFGHVNGGACFTDFDYNVEDGKTYYCENDSFNQKIEKKRKTAKYYIVSVSDQRQLMNGFRYIKELLLQNHNFHMYDAYEKLKEANINVYAVKTDAFHIAKRDLKKAKKVLNFHNDIGG